MEEVTGRCDEEEEKRHLHIVVNILYLLSFSIWLNVDGRTILKYVLNFVLLLQVNFSLLPITCTFIIYPMQWTGRVVTDKEIK